MLNIGRRPFYNKAIREYSLKSSNEYMRRLIEKNEIEKNTNLNKFSQQLMKCSSYENNNFNLIPFVIFISISTFIFFSNRTKI